LVEIAPLPSLMPPCHLADPDVVGMLCSLVEFEFDCSKRPV
jgi:hypothetical protein